MKTNNKAILSAAAILGVAGLVAGGTIAYFTDTKTETNTFTVGDVKITMYESQLHRQNSGRMGNFPSLASDPDYCDWTVSSAVATTAGDSTLINGSYDKARYCTPNMGTDVYYADDITAVANGHTKASRSWGFSDAQIIADAANYKAGANTTDTTDDGYFTRVSQGIVPGAWVRKFTYVKNNDTSSDAYVLIRYMVPTSYANNIEVKVPGTPYEEDVSTDTGHQGYFTAVTYDSTNNTYTAFDSSAKDSMDNYTGYIQEIDGTEYRVYAAVTTQALKPEEMTFWSPVNNVRLKTTVINTDTTDPNYVAPSSQVDVKVDAQAIQAKTFSNAIEAINNL
ncbi:SipW-dependent-type signal peptide-containing protein [Candidatus Saccharibacteria bacterium]|nr:SipW-dependent-type signal peptide-containing protein [Candidatus Saccharibacteria bacterium]